MTRHKYLVRPHDFRIFKLDKSNNCYRPYRINVEYKSNTRPSAQSHFTFENLTSNYEFFVIKKDEIEKYEKKNSLYNKWLSWTTRPDGHGSTKGGVMEEYLEKGKI